MENGLVPYDGIPIVRWLVLQRICLTRKIASSQQVISKVLINSSPVESLSQLVQEKDDVEYDGWLLVQRTITHVHYLLHKPPGCLSSRQNFCQLQGGGIAVDPRPSVYNFIPPEDWAHVQSIGRLDFDTTGLLLFTSDGILHHALASPKFKVDKIYRCTLRTPEPLSDEAIETLQRGVKLPHAQGAVVRGKAWNVSTGNCGTVVDLCINGGYKHQVKLMLTLVNRPLRLLHRRTFANLELPEDLVEGECRPLNPEEVEHLYSLARKQIAMHRAEEQVDTSHQEPKESKEVTINDP
jgi:pseudouridine synthase